MQIKGGTAAVGVFCFDDNEAMTQFQFELKFPTPKAPRLKKFNRDWFFQSEID